MGAAVESERAANVQSQAGHRGQGKFRLVISPICMCHRSQEEARICSKGRHEGRGWGAQI